MGGPINLCDLPNDILILISEKLIEIKDFVRFGAVSVTCHSVCKKIVNVNCLPRQPPVLMITSKEDNKDKEKRRGFYSLSEKRVYDFQLPMPIDTYCQGSGYGWLIMVEESLDIHLLNPFLSSINNNNKIQLPPLTTLEITEDDVEKMKCANIIGSEWLLSKVVLSANPSTTANYLVMVIYGGCTTLGFYKTGNKAWTSIKGKWNGFEDFIYFKGQLIALHCSGLLVDCDIDSPHPKMIQMTRPLPSKYLSQKKYIVESSGDLLQVTRLTMPKYIGEIEECFSTVGFEIFKLNPINKKNWIKVKTLNGCVLFLGDNSSMSLLAADFPELRPNCIYFTDDDKEWYLSRSPPYGPHDLGVFNLEDGSIESYYSVESPATMFPFIWVEPSLQGYYD